MKSANWARTRRGAQSGRRRRDARPPSRGAVATQRVFIGVVVSITVASLIVRQERIPKPIVSGATKSYLYSVTIPTGSVHGLDASPWPPARPASSGCSVPASDPLLAKVAGNRIVLGTRGDRYVGGEKPGGLALDFCQVFGDVEVVGAIAGRPWVAHDWPRTREQDLYGINIPTGAMLWQLDNPIRSPMQFIPSRRGRLLIGGEIEVSLIDTRTGSRAWQSTGGNVMVTGSGDPVVDTWRSVARLDLKTGAAVWRISENGALDVVGNHLVEAKYVTNCAASGEHRWGWLGPNGRPSPACPPGQKPKATIEVQIRSIATGKKERDLTVENVPPESYGSDYVTVRSLNANEAIVTLVGYDVVY